MGGKLKIDAMTKISLKKYQKEKEKFKRLKLRKQIKDYILRIREVKRVKLSKQKQVFITKFQENKDKMKQVTETKRADPVASLHAATSERIDAIRKNTKKLRMEIEKFN